MNPKSIVENVDCLVKMREMPDKAFDLAICDPPYGIGLDFVYNNGLRRKGSNYENKEWDNAVPTAEYFTELERVSSHQIVWGCNYYEGLLSAVGRIVWDKDLNIAHTRLNYSEAELASCSLQIRVTMFRYRWAGNIQGDKVNYSNSGLDGRIHPTQKPVALYKWLLTNYAKPGDTILDTHLGSGSSRIAAYDLGFDFVGYELDFDYWSAQEKRFATHIAQPKLWEPTATPMIQEPMFV